MWAERTFQWMTLRSERVASGGDGVLFTGDGEVGATGIWRVWSGDSRIPTVIMGAADSPLLPPPWNRDRGK